MAQTKKTRPLSKLPKADRELVTAAAAAVKAGRAGELRKLLPRLRERELIDYGGAVTLHNSLLQLAVDTGRVPIVTLLLDASAHVDSRDYKKCTPLMHAVKSRDLCALLLARGADIHARSTYDETAFHHAAKDVRAGVDVLELLLGAGAKVNDVGNAGRTALHHATARGVVDKIRALLEAGADANVVAQGQQGTPRQYLADCGERLKPKVREAIEELLLRAEGRATSR